MKTIFAFTLLALFLTGCVTAPKSLYSWEDYQERSYDYIMEENTKSMEVLMATYEKIINKQTGSRQTAPPGICADYGYLLYKQGKTQEGLALLNKEIALYPESSVFISRIIKNLQNEKNN